MEIWLLRHAAAEDRAASGRDADRTLTEDGHKRAREVARGLAALEPGIELILTSPYCAGAPDRGAGRPGPQARPSSCARRGRSSRTRPARRSSRSPRREASRRCSSSGHEPHLGALLGRLVAGPAGPGDPDEEGGRRAARLGRLGRRRRCARCCPPKVLGALGSTKGSADARRRLGLAADPLVDPRSASSSSEDSEEERMGKLGLGCLAILVILVVIVGISFAGHLQPAGHAGPGRGQAVVRGREPVPAAGGPDPEPRLDRPGRGELREGDADRRRPRRAPRSAAPPSRRARRRRTPSRSPATSRRRTSSAPRCSGSSSSSERYPELKANQNFRDLQAQLEGTENRITVARGRFNESAQGYNTVLKSSRRT